MAHYRVSFFKTLLNSTGHQFKCLQRQFDIGDAADENEASELAARQFETGLRGQDWRSVIDAVEVERIDGSAVGDRGRAGKRSQPVTERDG